jgi:hypothetical protein
VARIVDLSEARQSHDHKRKEAKVNALREAFAAARVKQPSDPLKDIKSFFKKPRNPATPGRPKGK